MWLLHTCASHLIAIVNKDGQTSTTDEPRPFPISSMQVCKCISLRVYQHLIQHTHAYIHTHTKNSNTNTSTSHRTSTQFPSSAWTLSILHYLQNMYKVYNIHVLRHEPSKKLYICKDPVCLTFPLLPLVTIIGTLLIFWTDLDTYIDLFVPCQNHQNV